ANPCRTSTALALASGLPVTSGTRTGSTVGVGDGEGEVGVKMLPADVFEKPPLGWEHAAASAATSAESTAMATARLGPSIGRCIGGRTVSEQRRGDKVGRGAGGWGRRRTFGNNGRNRGGARHDRPSAMVRQLPRRRPEDARTVPRGLAVLAPRGG